MIADANNFGVSFPPDLDVKVRNYSVFMKRMPRAKRYQLFHQPLQVKATLLGAVFLIDFMYFEKNQK